MDRFEFFRLFLFPSMLSGLTVLCATLAILGAGSFLYIAENQLFYDYLFGIHGVATILLQAPDSPAAIWGAITNGPFAYYTLLVLVSIMTGLTALAILQGISRITGGATFALHAIKEARLAQKEAIQETFERLMIRVLGLIIAALYAILFVDVLVPLTILLLQNGIDALDSAMWLEGIIRIGVSGILLATCLHVHIILARLYTLRLRVFGGADVQLAALNDASFSLRN